MSILKFLRTSKMALDIDHFAKIYQEIWKLDKMTHNFIDLLSLADHSGYLFSSCFEAHLVKII